ncbi:MAG: pilus assembly protein PilP [Gammaproteobacteria bacterium]|nr:MAG: pilus assembly protein PilP [Gammaproteobacteria bacterium]
MILKRYVRPIFVAVLVSTLSGCSSDNSDLLEWMAEVKAQTKPKVEPLPILKPYKNFIYEASHLPDPFENSLFDQQKPGIAAGNTVSSGISPDLNRPKEPLESFPLDALSMVGTLNQDGQTWAILQAPDKTVTRSSLGNYIGQNFGRITQIEDYSINLKEIIPDGLGGWIERDASISIVE